MIGFHHPGIRVFLNEHAEFQMIKKPPEGGFIAI